MLGFVVPWDVARGAGAAGAVMTGKDGTGKDAGKGPMLSPLSESWRVSARCTRGRQPVWGGVRRLVFFQNS